MRKGIISFNVRQINGIIPSSSFVGLTISNSVLAFLAIQWVFGICLFPLFWPLFWLLLKQYYLIILIPIVTAIGKTLLKLLASKFLCSPSFIKHRRLLFFKKNYFSRKIFHIFRLLSIYEFIILYMSLIGSIITGIVRFIISLVITLLTLNMIHQPLLPCWIERISFILLDKVNKAYLSLVYMHHLHNHPVLLSFVSFIEPTKNEKNEKKCSPKLKNVRNKFYLAYFLSTNKRFGLYQLRKKNALLIKEAEENAEEKQEKIIDNINEDEIEEEKLPDETGIKFIDNSGDFMRVTKDPSMFLGEISESEDMKKKED